MNKKSFLLLWFIGFSLSIFSQSFQTNAQAVKASDLGMDLRDVDEVFFFKGIPSDVQITYYHTESAKYIWYRYQGLPNTNTEISRDNNSSFNTQIDAIEHGYSYMLIINKGETNEQRKYISVIDYAALQLALVSNLFYSDGSNPCQEVELTAEITNPPIKYFSSTGEKTIPREFTLRYKTQEWNGETFEDKEVVVSKNDFPVSTTPLSTTFFVDAPLANTTFSLEADTIRKRLGMTTSAISTPDYDAVALEIHPVGEVSQRESLNEQDRSIGTSIGGSSPLLVLFQSNANTPVAKYFEWYINDKESPDNAYYYTDKDLRYTFKNYGLYEVKLIVSNETCMVGDSTLTVQVAESFLDVPNVFTPDGDGINDEFRVAYKSLKSFSCVIFNRWGRKVYEWSDPGRGWDGRIGGKVALPGAYYYIMEAEGADGKKYKKKGDINIIRGK